MFFSVVVLEMKDKTTAQTFVKENKESLVFKEKKIAVNNLAARLKLLNYKYSAQVASKETGMRCESLLFV